MHSTIERSTRSQSLRGLPGKREMLMIDISLGLNIMLAETVPCIALLIGIYLIKRKFSSRI